jgi:hypothetical protein
MGSDAVRPLTVLGRISGWRVLLSNWIVVIVLICVLSGIVTSFAKQVRKYVSHRHELEFKRDLVSRGLSVEEIERIVAAKSSSMSKDTA